MCRVLGSHPTHILKWLDQLPAVFNKQHVQEPYQLIELRSVADVEHWLVNGHMNVQVERNVQSVYEHDTVQHENQRSISATPPIESDSSLSSSGASIATEPIPPPDEPDCAPPTWTTMPSAQPQVQLIENSEEKNGNDVLENPVSPISSHFPSPLSADHEFSQLPAADRATRWNEERGEWSEYGIN